MSEQTTPETDAATHDLSDYGSPVLCSWGDWVDADFARKLERERDEAREYADKLAEGLPNGMLPKDVEVLREANLGLATELATVTAQRDEARETIATMEIRHDAVMLHTQSIVDEANQFREQRDRLAEALQDLIESCNCIDSVDFMPVSMPEAFEKAQQALQSLTLKP
jgi:hypothetical protein